MLCDMYLKRTYIKNLKILAVIVLAVTVSGCGRRSDGTEGKATETRNAVIFFVDTLRADHIGAYGYKRPTSPFVDKMAAGGVRFEDAYTPTPWTYTSAASLFTGLYPAAHGAFMPGTMRDTNETPRGVTKIDFKFRTIGHVAESAGMKTALFAANGYLGFGLQKGFGIFKKNRKRDAEKQVDLALKWLSKLDEDDRFLLIVHFMDVHHPSRARKQDRAHFPGLSRLTDRQFDFYRRWQGRYARGDNPQKKRGFKTFRKRRRDTYDAAIRSVDEQVRRLVSSLGKRSENTVVIFTADHGEEFWEHAGLERQLYEDPRGLHGIGHGHTFFEEQLRVPLVFYQPGVLKPRVVKGRALLIDIVPTLTDMLGIRDTAPREGVSLKESLLEGTPVADRPILLDEVCFGHPKQGILSGSEKFVRSWKEPSLLLNLKDDPGEQKNLMESMPEKAAALEKQLEKMLEKSRNLGNRIRGKPADKVHKFSDEELKALEALGYVWSDNKEDSGPPENME